MGENSLISLGELSKPATLLIEKVAGAIGGALLPYQLRRVARAEADVSKIKAVSELEITELQQRALHRMLAEETRRQENIEEIIARAIPHLDPNADPTNINDDWLTNFFVKGRMISDEDLRDLWARVLAGEANAAGSFSKRAINILSALEKDEAEQLTALWRFGVKIRGRVVPFVSNCDESIYEKAGVTWSMLRHLQNIELVTLATGYSGIPNQFHVSGFASGDFIEYMGIKLSVIDENTGEFSLPAGKVICTQAGYQLGSLCHVEPVDGFIEHLSAVLADYGFRVSSQRA